MQKFKRKERIALIVKTLCDNPNTIINLDYFVDMFGSAKSTISEDIAIIKETMAKTNSGKIITITGASGGIQYCPAVEQSKVDNVLQKISDKILEPDRLMAGDFIYITDILYDSRLMQTVGEMFAEKYVDSSVDYVMTIETKGIPLALMTARALNVPLVIARDENKLTEGPNISINYVSGSRKNVKTMYLAKRAIQPNSNVLIIDDVMRGGGTAKGMAELVRELNSSVVGMGFLIEIMYPTNKMVKSYNSLIKIDNISQKNIEIVY